MADRNADRFKGSMASSEISLEAVRPSARFRLTIGTPAPTRPTGSLNGLDTLASSSFKSIRTVNQQLAITRLFHTLFLRRWRPPARPARGPAGAPRHLLARLDGAIAGIVPCYLKSHSQGEYVFDRGWADAYERAGGRYYPKLQASVPFTPATGPGC